MFRGASALEGEVTDTAEFDTVTDEIRRWSSLSSDEFQRFVEDGVLNVSHLTVEANVEQVFSRAGQLSEVNLDPDTLVDMVSIMVNKLGTSPLSKISWTSTMRCLWMLWVPSR